MKYSYHHCLLLVLAALMASCASYKDKQQTAALSFPELGSIIQTKGSLWYATSEQVGSPNLEKPLALKVQQLPFNKASYGTYASYLQKAGKINSIPYVDSLPYKPKYLRLQILDKIGLVQILNTNENKNVRSFLENDDAYKIVTTLDFSVTDALMINFLNADTVVLESNGTNNAQLVLLRGKQEQVVQLSEIEVFDYEYATFCWGEDRYHNKRIETLLTGNESCPKGTFNKASKVTSDKSYLKF